MCRRQAGVTLMELMITVAIVGILAAIAYPSYRDQVRRSNRTEAKIALEQTALALEKCFTRYMKYNDANCAAAAQFDDGASIPSTEGHYLITGNIAATTFTLQADPQGGQATDAQCGTLELDERGARGVTGTGTPASCW